MWNVVVQNMGAGMGGPKMSESQFDPTHAVSNTWLKIKGVECIEPIESVLINVRSHHQNSLRHSTTN